MYQLSTRHGDSFNSLVDELFADFFHRANVPAARHSNTQAVSRARMDVLDKGGNFEVKVDLPGIRKDDIHVGIEGARVSINAESKDSSETKTPTARTGTRFCTASAIRPATHAASNCRPRSPKKVPTPASKTAY